MHDYTHDGDGDCYCDSANNRHNTTQYDAAQYNTLQCNTVQSSTTQHNRVQSTTQKTIQHNAVRREPFRLKNIAKLVSFKKVCRARPSSRPLSFFQSQCSALARQILEAKLVLEFFFFYTLNGVVRGLGESKPFFSKSAAGTLKLFYSKKRAFM